MIGWWIADMLFWGGAAMLALLALAQVVSRRQSGRRLMLPQVPAGHR